MAGRGQLTDEIKKIALEFLKREIDRDELRLYNYIDYVMKNEQCINPAHVNAADRAILTKLRQEGHIEGGASGLAITREFFDYMQNVLWVGYVAYDQQ